MLLLLVASAFFSGSETAFFNLSRRQINLFEKSKTRIQKLAASLLNKPKQLLACLLFGNMMVNVLFYAIASILTIRFENQIGVTTAAVVGCVSFCSLLLFGEILPKSLAYLNSKSICIIASLPLFLFLKIFAPLQFIFKYFIVEPTLRLILGPAKKLKPVTTDEFKSLIEQIGKRGLITADENKLLSEIIELGFLKVRDCLKPRVDMIACAVSEPPSIAQQIMLENNLTKLPVYHKTIDNIIGFVHFRHILTNHSITLDKLIQRVHFVPEQKTIESLIEFFRKTHIDTAIVVDEYGGIAGSVCLEDIVEELIGPIEIPEEVKPIEQLGPFEYRLSGNLSLYDWEKSFGIDFVETKITTIGGLLTLLLGKIPKPGDVAYLKNLKFTVEDIKKYRIVSVILKLEPIQNQ